MGALLLAALAVAASPAAPRQAQAQMSVEATVLPSCTISTASVGSAQARAVCSGGDSATVTTATSAPLPAAAGNSGAAGPSAVKVITVTY